MFLGIDIGTSAVKAVLVSADGARQGAATVPLATQRPEPGWSEQAPADWWEAVIAAVGQIDGREAVRGIGLAGQMHAAVCLNAGGRVIRPAILWNDSRAVAQAARLAAVPGFAERAGVVPMPGLTAPKLMWLEDHEPRRHQRVSTVLSAKDWIGFCLHGELATDTSDAAGTLWFDQARRAWSARLAEAAGADLAWFPQVLDGAAEAGRLTAGAAALLGLRPGTPVIAGAGDTVAGAVGIGAVVAGRSFLGIGTSGQIVRLDDAYHPSPAAMIHSFAFCLPGLWYRMAAMLNGARPLAWFAGIAGRALAELLAEAAATPPESAPLFLPYLTGERTPHGDAHIRAGFLGLGDDTGAPAMMRGVVEAVAYGFADAHAALGGPLDAPLAVGGGAQSELLLQTIADALGVPIRRPADAARGAAYGAARLAAYSGGAIGQGDLAAEPEVARVFLPDPAARDRHLAGLARYRAFYQAVKGV